MSCVIRAESLGKRFHIGERQRYLALRDILARTASAPMRIFRANPHSNMNDRTQIWALKNVSFDIHRGEVVGLIGRNGAGKTTLLKILARVTMPTVGFVDVRGRMGSLLEVGTGFHPELTGRENTFLSGAILGMRKAEIRRKFDEIVAFAEVEKFIDTPVKHYSTGMQTRLAFAVAAHLEPEILLVDEVLSVGDLQFQKKCLGKMSEVARSGRTILFVSHQMNQIRRLCGRVLWINGGGIQANGSTAEIVSKYESANTGAQELARMNTSRAKAYFESWEIIDPPSGRIHAIKSLGEVVVRFVIRVKQPLRNVHHGIVLYDANRQLVWGTGFDNIDLEAGTKHFTYRYPTLPLRPGPYNWYVTLMDHGEFLDRWEAVPELLVETQPLTHRMDEWAGFLNIPAKLEIDAGPPRSDIDRKIDSIACAD